MCYPSFSLAVIAGGVTVSHSSVHRASLSYAASVAALSAIAATSALARRSSHKRHAGRLGAHNLPTTCAALMTETAVIDRPPPAPQS